MTPRISLICAPPHRNPGMCSVDLAFEHVLQRRGRSADLRRYAYGGPYEAVGLATRSLGYASLEVELDAVLASDVILFWGDFQHAHSFWRTGLRRRPGGTLDVTDEHAETARVATHLLLDGQPDAVLAKTVSFGTCLLGDNTRVPSPADATYRAAFAAFTARAHRIWCRDPISAAQVARLRPDRDETCLGVDAALLLTPDDYGALANPSARPDGHLAVFFGRLGGSMAGPARLTAHLARLAGLEAVWVPWLGPGGGPPAEVTDAVPGLEVDPADSYEDLLALVAGARLVVTDAYHLCLIAWRLGIPAICVGVGAQRATRPVSDKKKEVFHLAQGLAPLYVFLESLSDERAPEPVARALLDLALDRAYVRRASSALAGEADAAEARLWATIEGLLG